MKIEELNDLINPIIPSLESLVKAVLPDSTDADIEACLSHNEIREKMELALFQIQTFNSMDGFETFESIRKQMYNVPNC